MSGNQDEARGIWQKALEKSPDARYANARAMLEALRGWDAAPEVEDEEETETPASLTALMEAGHLGAKTGQGFYKTVVDEKGKKSLAYTFTYRSAKQTLTDKKVNKAHEKLTGYLLKEHGATLRDG